MKIVVRLLQPILAFALSTLAAVLLSGCFQNAQVTSTGFIIGNKLTFDGSGTDSLTHFIGSITDSFIVEGSCGFMASSIEVSPDGGASWVPPHASSSNATCTNGRFSIFLPGDLILSGSGWSWGSSWSPLSPGNIRNLQLRTLGALGASASAALDVGFPVIEWSSATSNVAEGAGNVVLTANLSGPVSSFVIVNYYSTDGGGANPAATSGVDYAATGGTLTIFPWTTSGTVTISIANDVAYESDQDFSVNLSSVLSGNATLGATQVNVVTITDDDLPTPNAITLNSMTTLPVSYNSFTVTVPFIDDVDNDSSVMLYYCNDTDSPLCDPMLGFSVSMIRGSGDYTATVGSLTIPNDPGDLIKILVVATDSDGAYDISGDASSDGQVSASVRLKAEVKIMPPMSNSDEWGFATGTIQVNADPSQYPITVELTTGGGTAMPYLDYWPLFSQSITIGSAGENPKTFAVSILSNILKETGPRTFDVTPNIISGHLTKASVNPSFSTSTFTIIDDDDNELLNISQIAFSAPDANDDGFSCLIDSLNKLKCWGLDRDGRLGDGPANDGLVLNKPPATPILSSVTQVAMGKNFACALSGSTVQCWGDNSFGQLGNGLGGAGVFNDTPVIVSGLSGVLKIVAADTSACALLSSGQVKCWGDNSFGQTGHGSDGGMTTSPMLVETAAGTNLNGVQATPDSISAGSAHYCVIMASPNKVICWGKNTDGQLGDGTATNKPFATAMPLDGTTTNNKASQITAGANHTCAITQAPDIKCWGKNADGQVGDSTTAMRSTPVSLDPLAFTPPINLLVAGANHTCAKDSSGIKCWGDNSEFQLGDKTGKDHWHPEPVSQLSANASDIIKIFSGGQSTCFRYSGGGFANQTHCFGQNKNGQLARGEMSYQPTPVDVRLSSDSETLISLDVSRSYSVGGMHLLFSCGILNSGNVPVCWGSNQFGQLGNNDASGLAQNIPVPVSGLGAVSKISTGGAHACAISTSGALYCWGNNSNGQLGNGTITSIESSPVVIDSGTNYSEITTGAAHTCGITTTGVLKCWGNNSNGQLGDSTTAQRSSPVVIDIGTNYSRISAGAAHTCGTTSGVLKCWGNNSNGQLGDGTTIQRIAPVMIGGTYSEISAGAAHTCGTTTANVLKCWGDNTFGQLGDGTATQQTAPVDVFNISNTPLADVALVSAGAAHTCATILPSAMVNPGAVYCWGNNHKGQTGYVTGFNAVARYGYNKAEQPVDQMGVGVASVVTKGNVSCALLFNGRAKCWGENYFGNLGNKNAVGLAMPIRGP